MKYRVWRASEIYNTCANSLDEARLPCPESKVEKVKRKTVFGADFCVYIYVVEINTLEELDSFIKKHGDIIIYSEDDASGYREICIYDGYVG